MAVLISRPVYSVAAGEKPGWRLSGANGGIPRRAARDGFAATRRASSVEEASRPPRNLRSCVIELHRRLPARPSDEVDAKTVRSARRCAGWSRGPSGGDGAADDDERAQRVDLPWLGALDTRDEAAALFGQCAPADRMGAVGASPSRSIPRLQPLSLYRLRCHIQSR